MRRPPAPNSSTTRRVYAISKRIVAAAAKQPLETITRDWLTGPAGLANTGWRKRGRVPRLGRPRSSTRRRWRRSARGSAARSW